MEILSPTDDNRFSPYSMTHRSREKELMTLIVTNTETAGYSIVSRIKKTTTTRHERKMGKKNAGMLTR